MSTTREAAIDEILGKVQAVIASTAAVVGYAIEMRWPGIERNAPDWSKYWGRASYKTADETQAAFASNVEAEGQRMFQTDGVVFVQLFCPKSDVEAHIKGGRLAKLFRDAFRAMGSTGEVEFFNARIQELDPDRETGSIRFNVVADYQYDELG